MFKKLGDTLTNCLDVRRVKPLMRLHCGFRSHCLATW
jgi:hypothetical protein